MFSTNYSGNVLLLLIEGKTGNVFIKMKIISVIASFQIRQKYFKKEKLASLEDQDLEEGTPARSHFISGLKSQVLKLTFFCLKN